MSSGILHPPSSTTRLRSPAFTLLEVMIAVVILTVAMLAIIEGLARSLNAVQSLRNYSTATELMAIKLADLERLTALEEGSEEGDFEDNPAGFSWTTDILATELQDLYQVTIRIHWTEQGHEASESMVTFLYEEPEGPRRLSDAARQPGATRR